MNRTRAKELLEVITAFANGETIQAMCDNGDWVDTPCTSWMDTVPYRIKPKPRLRPWTPEEAPKVLVVRKRNSCDGEASVAHRHYPFPGIDGKLGVNVFVPANCMPASATPKEKVVSVPFADLLRDYVRIDEQGNEHPCGVEAVE